MCCNSRRKIDIRGSEVEFGKIGSGAGRVSTVMLENRAVRSIDGGQARMKLATRPRPCAGLIFTCC